MVVQRRKIGDVELGAEVRGEGPVLMFVHGFPLYHAMWDDQIEEFSRDHRVIAPDLRGFGASRATEGTVTMEQFADDLAELLDALQVDQPATLCGLSMGGYIAWQFWRRHRRRLGRLILCDTRAAADTDEAQRGRLVMAERVLSQGPEVVVDPMVPKLLCADTVARRPTMVQRLREMMVSNSAIGIAAAQRGMAQRPDVSDWLPEIDVPSLLVCGKEDVISSPAEMKAIAEVMPQARFAEIPAAGHMAPLENPEEFNATLRGFLQQTPS